MNRPGITPAALAAAKIREVEPAEAFAATGYREPGILIPYFNAAGSALNVNNKEYARLRLSNPSSGAKYLSPASSGCQLYIPIGLRALLVSGSALGIVEGEFKAIALIEAGFPCVGIGGISSACPRNEAGAPELLPALAHLITEIRPVRIMFIGDSDTSLIADFSREAVKLAKLAGVPVALPRIPLGSPGKGPDDLRELWGAEFPARWQAILDAAEIVGSDTKPSALLVRLLERERTSLRKLDSYALNKARERIIKLAHAVKDDPLALANIETIAAEEADLCKATLRTSLDKFKSEHVAASAIGKLTKNTPLIVLPSGDVSITAAAEQIFGLIGDDQGLFFRGGRVHEIAASFGEDARRLEPVSPAQFRSRIEDFGRVFTWRRGANREPVLKPNICPEETARALLESRPARDRLPNVSALSACPVLANTGDEVRALGTGWHAIGGGIYVTGGELPPKVPIIEAVERLSALLDDFDFASPSDRSRALASLIAPALRFGSWLATPLPVDVGEADSSQSGKTYRQKVVAAIYRERCNVVVQRAGGVGGFDESLSQKLIDGRPFILLDNLRGRLDSPFFEAILTAPGSMPARVPHRGEVQVDPRGFVFQITSNGVETTCDLANRSSIVRIRKRPRGYVFKNYLEGDLHAHVIANQAFYLGCVFSVISEWAMKGQPRTNETRHDFREWAQVLDWIMQNIFKAAPLLDGHDEARTRVSDPRRIWLRSICIAIRDVNRHGELGAAQLAEFAIESDLLPPNVRTDAENEVVSRAIGKVMAGAFAESESIEIDGFTIQRARRYSEAADKEIPVYRFGGTKAE